MPSTIALTDLLEREDIHLHFQSPSVVDAVPQLLRAPLTRRGLPAPAIDRILEAVIHREQETATVCGSLALPHARSAEVHDFVFAIAANADGVIAGRPQTRLIFAFVTPDQKREQHLQLLAWLARLAQDPQVVSQIAGASSADQVMEALRTAGA